MVFEFDAILVEFYRLRGLAKLFIAVSQQEQPHRIGGLA
jgi:hypothetical protein